MTATPPKKSDLGTRTLSAIVMVAVAGTALWLGGSVWTAFVAVVALGVLWEWWGLVRGFLLSTARQLVWIAIGLIYVGFASFALSFLRTEGIRPALIVLAVVIAVDVGAYFAGRTFGGPKIAPKISPSKTWSGLIGGVIGATAILYLSVGVGCESNGAYVPSMLDCLSINPMDNFQISLVGGAIAAVVAQAGDFFESWMKRRAGVKDSGTLIPGHGGLFDRLDGLLAVLAVVGVLPLIVGFLRGYGI